MVDGTTVFLGAPYLEPLAGAAVALNVAYIGLERFRYRERIRQHARRKRSELSTDEGSLSSNIKSLRVYVQLTVLCELLNNDGTEANTTRAQQRMPGHFWGWAYDWVFRIHLDRGITLAASAINLFILACGVAHNINRWSTLIPVFGDDWIGAWFYLVLAAILAPVLLAWRGRRVVTGACRHADECVEEIEKSLKDQVAKAPIPEVAAQLEGQVRTVIRPRATIIRPPPRKPTA